MAVGLRIFREARENPVFLNMRLGGVTLVPTMRQPFDALVEGLLTENSRLQETQIERFIAGSMTLNMALLKHITRTILPVENSSSSDVPLP